MIPIERESFRDALALGRARVVQLECEAIDRQGDDDKLEQRLGRVLLAALSPHRNVTTVFLTGGAFTIRAR